MFLGNPTFSPVVTIRTSSRCDIDVAHLHRRLMVFRMIAERPSHSATAGRDETTLGRGADKNQGRSPL